MVTKVANVYMIMRDSGGNENGSAEVSGWTDDDGQTVTLGLGYLPGIETAAANGDVTLRVVTEAVAQSYPTEAVTVPDYENNTQTITFTL